MLFAKSVLSDSGVSTLAKQSVLVCVRCSSGFLLFVRVVESSAIIGIALVAKIGFDPVLRFEPLNLFAFGFDVSMNVIILLVFIGIETSLFVFGFFENGARFFY